MSLNCNSSFTQCNKRKINVSSSLFISITFLLIKDKLWYLYRNKIYARKLNISSHLQVFIEKCIIFKVSLVCLFGLFIIVLVVRYMYCKVNGILVYLGFSFMGLSTPKTVLKVSFFIFFGLETLRHFSTNLISMRKFCTFHSRFLLNTFVGFIYVLGKVR